MELSKNLLNQIETHKENKPFNPFLKSRHGQKN